VIPLAAAPIEAAVLYTGSPIVETFDGMPTSGPTPPTTLTSPFSSVIGTQALVTGTNGWEATKLAGTGTTAMPFIADNGSGNSGAIYSYGAPEATERALGGLSSGSNTPAFGLEVVNNTATSLSAVTISFTQENWRSSTSSTGAPNIFNASFGTTDSGGTSATFLSAATGFTDADLLDLVGPTPVTTNGALNGNDPLNQAPRIAIIPVSVGPGESFFLRFQDFNDQGNDAGLAVDNFTINFTSVIPEPGTFTLAALSLLSLGLLRRRG
jgi:hypothetical protein